MAAPCVRRRRTLRRGRLRPLARGAETLAPVTLCLDMHKLSCRALVAVSLMSIAAGSKLEAQVQRYYETNDAFYLRQASQRSMENLRAMQAIRDARRRAYQKAGDARIAAKRASLLFIEDPTFLVTAFLLKQIEGDSGSSRYVPLIRAESAPALARYRMLLSKEGKRRDDYADGVSLIFDRNFEILTGRGVPAQLAREQSAQLRSTLLADGVFQGTPDIEKQAQLEAMGVQTIFAFDQMQLARAGDGAAGATARQIARAILWSLLGRQPDSSTLVAISRGEMPASPSLRQAAAGPSPLTPPHPSAPPSGDLQAIVGARETYVYNTDLAVARNVAIESVEKFSDAYAQQLLDQFYRQLTERGGARNNLADVGALLVFLSYFVVSDGQELSTRQYVSTRSEMRQSVLSSEALQQMPATDLQFLTEKEIIHAVNNYVNFRRDRAILQRGVAGQTYQGQHYGASDLVRSERTIALGTLDRLFGSFRSYRLTADGFVR